MEQKHTIVILLVLMLALVGCGGGSIGIDSSDPVNQTGREQGAVSWSEAHHKGIGPDARQDYRQAMYEDCALEREDCSLSGEGWFHAWNQLPEVHVSSNSTQQEVWAIRRAIGILNRFLPVEYRHT